PAIQQPAHEQLGCSWGERSDSYAPSFRSFKASKGPPESGPAALPRRSHMEKSGTGWFAVIGQWLVKPAGRSDSFDARSTGSSLLPLDRAEPARSIIRRGREIRRNQIILANLRGHRDKDIFT